jgi:hypothetical protein
MDLEFAYWVYKKIAGVVEYSEKNQETNTRRGRTIQLVLDDLAGQVAGLSV